MVANHCRHVSSETALLALLAVALGSAVAWATDRREPRQPNVGDGVTSDIDASLFFDTSVVREPREFSLLSDSTPTPTEKSNVGSLNPMLVVPLAVKSWIHLRKSMLA